MPSDKRLILARLSGSPVRRDLAFLLADRVLRIAIGFFVIGLIGRHLGTAAFGSLNYAIAIMTFGTVIAQLGLDGIVVRELVRQPSERNEILGSALVLRAVSSATVALVIFSCSFTLSGAEPTQRKLISILALGAFVPALHLPALWFQARTETRFAIRVSFAGFLAATVLRLVLLATEAKVTSFAWVILGETVVGGILVTAAMLHHGGHYKLHKVSMHCRALLRDSWPLLVSGLAITIYMRTDTVMLRWLAGADAVGIYAAATRLSEATYAIPMLAATSVMATLTAVSDDAERFNALVDRYFSASAACGYAIVLPMFLIAPWLMRTLFGEGFVSAGAIAQLHLISVVFVFLGVARSQVLVIRGLTRFSMVSTVIGAVANIVLNTGLIPQFGPTGAAIATVLSFAVSDCISGFALKETRSLARLQMTALFKPWRGVRAFLVAI